MSCDLGKLYESIASNKQQTDETIITKEFFESIWSGIKIASIEVYVLLWSSFQRFNANN